MTYTVKWEDYDSQAHSQDCKNMSEAMELSKHLKDCANLQSEIVTDEFVLVGSMGSNVVVDGKLPDGNDYTWFKRRPDPHK